MSQAFRRVARPLLAVAALLLLTIIAYLNIPGRVSGDAFISSMHRSIGASGIYCVDEGRGEDRSCQIIFGSDSSGPEYDVDVTGRCWVATLTTEPAAQELESSSEPGARYEGCIVIGDNLRPLGRLLYADGAFDIRPEGG